MTTLTMKEEKRLEVIQRVFRGELTVMEAGMVIGVSERQCYRIKARESAHEIRQFGNYGAHVQDDGLDKVTSDEARNAREVTWQFLYSIYIAPAKTAELKKARQGKGKP
jgi:Domain of unknown function (DUF4145)